MDINNTILDLNTVYTTFTHGETVQLLEQLKNYEEEFIIYLDELRSDSTDIEDRLLEIILVEEQMEYLTHNIKTLENAILCHETKTFEKMNIRGNVSVLCLN